MEATLLDFFAGSGGMGLGFKGAGFRIVGSYDWDKYAVTSYKHNVESHAQQADIRAMKWHDLPTASVWTFGFPCQDLSVAGAQAGMIMTCLSCNNAFPLRLLTEGKCPTCESTNVTSSTRSGLFFEIMRLLDETSKHAPKSLPAIIMAENVKGLKPYLGTLHTEYERAGYVMSYQLFNSKYWGVPQSRERYYVVGVRADLLDQMQFAFPVEQKEFIPRLSTILETDVAEKYYMSDEKAQAIIEQAMLRLQSLGSVHATLTPARVEKRQNGRRAREDEEAMFTLTAQDIHGVIVDQLQTVYTDKDECAYCCDANYFKGTSPGDVGSGRRTQVIELKNMATGEVILKSEVPESCIIDTREVAATSELSSCEDYGHYPSDFEPKIEMMGLLDIKGKDQIRRVYDPNGLAPTLTAVQGGLHEAKIFDYSRYRVRKLTPREYMRLQGFPESYVQVVSDSQSYRQSGNAVTVNVAKAIAEKIREALEGI